MNPLASNLPRFVTFTGVDEHVSQLALQVLSSQYPVEWGVLFSPQRQGTGRYPPLAVVDSLIGRPHLRLAAHLCGDYAQEFIETGTCLPLHDFLPAFHRIQVNTARPDIDTSRLRRLTRDLDAQIILQCRGELPADRNVTWLFDLSGGRGITPAAWPASHDSDVLVGYAGGLGPDNIKGAVASIAKGCSNFYVDMESGVRDIQDRLDVNKCRQVLQVLYAGHGTSRPAYDVAADEEATHA